MRALLRKNKLFLSSCSSSAAHAFLLRLPGRELSCSPHEWSRSEEESRNVKVSVWWDFENCQVPAGIDALKVGPAIMEAVRANGIKGPIHINAFGDVLQLSKSNQEALAYTGISLTHIPGGKNNADRFLLLDLMHWVSHNPPPAHLFLISGDKDFAGILHRLRMKNYNILLAGPGNAHDVLCSAATLFWEWSLLIKGEDFCGRHCNHAPDGSRGSSNGNYKVTLDNPVSTVENVEVIHEPSVDSKLCVVPKSIVRAVCTILRSHPKGILMTDLRLELAKSHVRLGKNFYGYKTFSLFLLSMPCVQLLPLNGNFRVILIPMKYHETVENNAGISGVSNGERQGLATLKGNGEDDCKARKANGATSTALSGERSTDDESMLIRPVTLQGKTVGEHVDVKSSLASLVERDVSQPPNESHKYVCVEKDLDVATAQVSEIQLPNKDKKVSKTNTGSLKTGCEKSSDDIVRSEEASHKILEKNATPRNGLGGNDQTMVENIGIAEYVTGKFEAANNYEDTTGMEVEVCCGPDSSPVENSVVGKRPGGSNETCKKDLSFFSWIRNWWPFWNGNAKAGSLTVPQDEVFSHSEDSNLPELDLTVQTVSHFKEPKLSELDQNVYSSRMSELLSSASFWNDMENFVFTLKGTFLVSISKSREDMAQKLQEDGPLILGSLAVEDILQLVELLIAQKKWLEENPSKTYPFRLIQRVQLVSQSHDAGGLRSLFLNRSQSNTHRSLEHDVEKHNHNIPNSRVPDVTATEMKNSERSNIDILEDCQKLVSEILREHPEGYDMCSFRRLFVDRYGYRLDLQKLGHPKLASLLQEMPGIKLESSCIFPSVPAVCASDGETSTLETEVANGSHAYRMSNLDSVLSDSVCKDDDMESQWEELGPDNEPSSDHDSSESEGDCSALTQPPEQGKPKCNEQDSSLLQALDSLHTSKERENNVKNSDNVDVLGIYLADILDSSTELTRANLSTALTQPPEQGKPKCNEQDSSLLQALGVLHTSKERENNVKNSDNVDVLGIYLADILDSSTESTRANLSKGSIEKRRSQRKYSFVCDPVLPNKDKDEADGVKNADEAKIKH